MKFFARLGHLLVFTALFFSIGSAAAAESEPASLKRIGVVSMAGDVLFERRLGVTAFGNKALEFNVADLGLDDAWESRIEEYLSSLEQYEVVPVSVDRSPLIATYNKGTIVNNWRYLRFKKTAPIFADIAAQNDLDYLLVLGADAYDVVEGVMRIEGAGVFTSKNLGGATTIYHLIGQLALIDGASGKPLEQEYLSTGSRWKLGYGGFPVGDAPVELTGKSYAAYSIEEKAALRDALIEIADRGMAHTLSKLLKLQPPLEESQSENDAEAASSGGVDAPAEGNDAALPVAPGADG